eukprot:jgi/Phyca11/511093/fgenesh2_kg.PHYCAscaffold_75_\
MILNLYDWFTSVVFPPQLDATVKTTDEMFWNEKVASLRYAAQVVLRAQQIEVLWDVRVVVFSEQHEASPRQELRLGLRHGVE